MAARETRGATDTMQSGNAATIEELRATYSGEWLALKVTDRHASGSPRRAQLLAHAQERSQLYELVRGQGQVCIVFGGDLIPEGHEAIL